MNKILILTLIASLSVLSCAKDDSGNVNQDSIYTIYELFFNKKMDKTTARATFRFGGPTGTLLDLTDPALAEFNGDNLAYAPVTGVHKKEYSGFTTMGTFVYTDLDNNTYTNTTPSIDTIEFPAVDSIDAANAFTFTWVGNPIMANETVTLTVNGTQQANAEIFSSSVVGATELILAANKLQRLGDGLATAVLQRAYNKLTLDEAPPEGGRMAVWYQAEKSIYIKN